MIFEIAGIKETLNLQEQGTSDHYKMTPYKFEPEQHIKFFLIDILI